MHWNDKIKHTHRILNVREALVLLGFSIFVVNLRREIKPPKIGNFCVDHSLDKILTS